MKIQGIEYKKENIKNIFYEFSVDHAYVWRPERLLSIGQLNESGHMLHMEKEEFERLYDLNRISELICLFQQSPIKYMIVFSDERSMMISF